MIDDPRKVKEVILAETNKALLTETFRSFQKANNPATLELLDKNLFPVAILYLDELKHKKLWVSEVNNFEKFGIYVDGVLIYFTYFRKL